VFSTGMSGYRNTDPSYHGQSSYHGAADRQHRVERGRQRRAKIWWLATVRDPSPRASNWRATGVGGRLARQGIVGIAGIDTRVTPAASAR
jgi:carbamoyl-phosphate synthase small subunit